MSQRERREEFLSSHGIASGLAGMLARSATSLLTLAVEDRKVVGAQREATDHYAPHGPGAIVMVLTAFDVCMTEALAQTPWLHVEGSEEAKAATEHKEVAARGSTCDKFDRLAQLSGAEVREPRVRTDLARLVVVRHEIAHHLPRYVDGRPRGSVPPSLAELYDDGLFLRGGKLDFPQMLASYSVAHWSFRTVEAASRVLAAGTNPSWKILGMTAPHFWSYADPRRSVAPADLAAFDAAHGLTLTTTDTATP